MTFVDRFHRYLCSRTHAPPVFHQHAALAVLSQAVGKNLFVSGWGANLYPNLYAIIIAPSGSGKSVPLDMAGRLLHQAGIDTTLPNSFSVEGLISELAKTPTGIFLVQEFAAFLGMARREYNSGAEEILTELYDIKQEPWKRALRSGNSKMDHPFVSLLGASSPSWFIGAFKAEALTGGFLARFVWCPSGKLGPRIHDPGDFDGAEEVILTDHLRQIVERMDRIKTRTQWGVKVDLSRIQSTINRFDEAQESRIQHSPEEFRGLRSRATALVKKMTVLYMVGRDPGAMAATHEDVEAAIEYVTTSNQLAEEFLVDSVPRNERDLERIRLRQTIRNHPDGISWSVLLKLSHLDGQEFERAIRTLETGGDITIGNRKTGGAGRPSRWITATPKEDV